MTLAPTLESRKEHIKLMASRKKERMKMREKINRK